MLPINSNKLNWRSLFNEEKINQTKEFDRSNLHPPIPDQLRLWESLSVIYKTDLGTFPKNMDESSFLTYRDLIIEIETFLQRKHDIVLIPKVRTLVSKAIALRDYQQKMIELGLILYYLNHENILSPQFLRSKNLIDYFASQISMELKILIDNKMLSIPTGKTNFLLNIFAKLAVTSDCILNHGGIMAIQALLNSPYKISIYLSQEHRDHILKICHQLLTNPSLSVLFKKRFRIHPDLHNVIRYDFKLAPNHKITPADVIYDCVKALFTDIRQYGRPNCFVVSSIIYLSENYTYKMIQQALQWMSEGVIRFDKNEIPLSKLIENRLRSSDDLEVNLELKEILKLSLVKHLFRILNLRLPDRLDCNEVMSINQFLVFVLNENQAIEHLAYAKKVLCSYKYNALIDLVVLSCELIYLNTHPKNSCSLLQKSLKFKLLDSSLIVLKNEIKFNFECLEQFFSKLENKLYNNICLVSWDEKKIKLLENENSEVQERTNLSSIVRNSVRIFDSKKNKIIKLISEFQAIFNAAIKETANDLKDLTNKVILRSHLINAANSAIFREHLVNFCSFQMQKKEISSEVLNSTDLFLLSQKGGHGHIMLEHVYGVNIEYDSIPNYKTAYQFVKNLMGQFQSKDYEFLNSTPRILMYGDNDGGHLWTLTPNSWKLLIENKNRFEFFIEKIIFRPVKTILKNKIPFETIQRIVKRYVENDNDPEAIYEFFKSAPPTFENFSQQLQSIWPISDSRKIKTIIEEEFSKVTICKLKLTRILSLLNVRVNSDTFNSIYQLLPLTPSSPASLAISIRKQLILNRVSVLDTYQIEYAVCTVFALPIPIEVGDLNWANSYCEKPQHEHLMIKYSWMLNTLTFFRRIKNKDYCEDANYSSIAMNFPKQ